MDILLEIIIEVINDSIKNKRKQQEEILEEYGLDKILSKKKQYYILEREIEALQSCSNKLIGLVKYIDKLL